MSDHEDCTGCKFGQRIVLLNRETATTMTKTLCYLHRQSFKDKGPGCSRYHKREENENND